MAKDIYDIMPDLSYGSYDIFGCYKRMAERHYEQGYRNCKDKVVLSKEEYARLRNLEINYEDTYKNYREYAIENNKLKEELNDYKQRYESAEKRYEQLVQSSCEALAKKGKEMQEEIAKASKLKSKTIRLAKQERAREIFTKIFALHGNRADIMYFEIEELAKQYGVEVE